jgi:membrane fusion protein
MTAKRERSPSPEGGLAVSDADAARSPEQQAENRLSGEVIVALPPRSALMLGIAALCVVFFASVAAFGSMAHTVAADGWIVPDQGLIRVKAHAPGAIVNLAAAEGATVQPHQTLAVIRSASWSAGDDIAQSLDQELQEEGAARSAQLASQRQAAISREAQVRTRGALIAREIAQSEVQVRLLEERVQIAYADLERFRQLIARGFMSEQALDNRRAAALAIEGQLADARRSRLSLEREQNELRSEGQTLVAELQSLAAQQAEYDASLAQRRLTNTATNSGVIAAPVAGRILALPHQAGENVRAGDTVAVISPADSVLVAELMVPADSASEIERGQQVEFQLSGLPRDSSGAGTGTVSRVSDTPLAPDEVEFLGRDLQRAIIRVQVRLDSDHVLIDGQRRQLQPGMLLTARVILARRTLLQQLLR